MIQNNQDSNLNTQILIINSDNRLAFNFDIIIVPRESNSNQQPEIQNSFHQNSSIFLPNSQPTKSSFLAYQPRLPSISTFIHSLQSPINSNIQTPMDSNSKQNLQHSVVFKSTPNFQASTNHNISQQNPFDLCFKMSFLELLSKFFPAIIRKFLSNFLLLPQCSEEIQKSLSIRVISRFCIKDLIKVVHKYSSSFCSILDKDYCISLLQETYEKYFANVPNQKKSRFQNFKEILLIALNSIGEDQKLMNIRIQIQTLSTKFK
jgi:hypothetical protein